MRRTIINLTRFGDLLQTQPIIHGLRSKGFQPGLICLDNFAGAVDLLQGVEHTASLPGSRILAGLEKDWRLCADGVKEWCDEEKRYFPASSVLNLTPTLAARLLGRLLQEEGQSGGFGLDEYGFGCNGNAWATYVQAATLRRGCSPYNLVDGFRRMADVGDVEAVYELKAPSAKALQSIQENLAASAAARGFAEHEGYVGLQLGASNDIRRWPVAHFAELGRLLWEKAGLVPLLLGSKAEMNLAERYLQSGAPGLPLAGSTSLPELAAVLASCRLLVSNDTGTMHLAAGLKTPVLAIFLATAQPWDTGPYQENMCCLEPRLTCHPCGFSTQCPHDGLCRTIISADAVGEIILAWIDSGMWPNATKKTASEARVWLTRRDSAGFMDLASLSGDEGTDRTLWIRIQREFYRRFLDGMGRTLPEPNQMPNKSAGESESEAVSSYTLTAETRERLQAFLAQADGMLLLAAEQGRLLTMRPSENARKNLLATCERMTRLFDTSADFTPLSWLWRDMLQEYAGNFDDLLRFFISLREHLSFLACKINKF